MRILLIFVLISVMSGCATGYQPEGMTGGYSDIQLDKNVFKVTFKGNGFTRQNTASDFALLQSAELTLKHGFKYFKIVDANKYLNSSKITTPTTTTTNINMNSYGTSSAYGAATTTTVGGQTYNISKPTSTDTIVCFTKKPSGFSYNADFVAKNIRKKYGLK